MSTYSQPFFQFHLEEMWDMDVEGGIKARAQYCGVDNDFPYSDPRFYNSFTPMGYSMTSVNESKKVD